MKITFMLGSLLFLTIGLYCYLFSSKMEAFALWNLGLTLYIVSRLQERRLLNEN